MRMRKITRKDVEKAIFDGIFPTAIFKIDNFNIIYTISERPCPSTMDGWMDFFYYAIQIPGCADSRVVLGDFPFPLFYNFIRGYKKFYTAWLTAVLLYVPEIVETEKSRTAWRICQTVAIEKVIPVQERINVAQYFWLGLCSAKEVSDRHLFISNILENLQPWLNIELWKHMQKEKDAVEDDSLTGINSNFTRANSAESAQIQAYLNSLQEKGTDISECDEISVE